MSSQITTWVTGITTLTLVCTGIIFIIVYLYLYKKHKNKVYFKGVSFSFSVAFGFTGITLSFLSVIIYGNVQPGFNEICGYFAYSAIPIGVITVANITWDLFLSPKHKKKAMIVIMAYFVVYYIVLYVTIQEAIICPPVPKGEILDDWVSPTSIFYYLVWGGVSFAGIIAIIGFFKFSKMTAGDVKKRSLNGLIAGLAIGIGILLDTVILISPPLFTGFLTPHVNFLFIPRLLVLLGLFLIYRAFRPSK